MQEQTDILIVGAGPTGLALALELAKHGASFRIVEKELERDSTSRALVIQPRTQELLNRHTNFREEVLAKSRTVRGVRWHLSKTRKTHADFSKAGLVDTGFPSIVNVSQVETERFLESNLGRVTAPDGGRYMVERGLEATAIVQDHDGVTVTLSRTSNAGDEDGNGDGGGTSPAQQTVRCKYVVGCDGSHSAVRKAATSIRYEGGTYQHDFILCDATLTGGSLLKGNLEVGLAGRFIIAMPLADGIVRIACARDRGPGFERHVAPSLAEFQTLLDETYESPGTLSDPTWLTAYRLHWRCASRYRDGRLFVAGDAAHIHSPLGGQGMNTGIQDAINLGWKLAAATRAGSRAMDAAAADALLDTYDEERRPVGERLMRTTDRLFRFVTVRNRVVVWLRKLLLPWLRAVALSTAERRRRFFLFISEFGVSYRGSSSIVGTASGFRGPVRGGDRLPDGRLVDVDADGGKRDGGVVLPREATLQRLCGGTAHHLLLFSAAGAAAASTRDLALAGAEVVAARSDVVAVAIVCGSNNNNNNSSSSSSGGGGDDGDGVVKTEAQARPITTCRDPDGSLHARYGFSKKPGYVLSRPDGYAAHVGHLSDLGELVSFLKR